MTDEKYYKLSDIRALLEKETGQRFTPSHAAYYTMAPGFPKPVINEPIRLWRKESVKAWVKRWKKDYMKKRRG